MDNGPAFVQALEYLAEQYNICHIRISPYNSRANRPVEHRHYDVREALVKTADSDERKWHSVAHAVFWAERTTIQKSTGYSPYYMAHGVEPLFPFDIQEATYLGDPMWQKIPTTDLISLRARRLQKRQDDLDNMF